MCRYLGHGSQPLPVRSRGLLCLSQMLNCMVCELENISSFCYLVCMEYGMCSEIWVLSWEGKCSCRHGLDSGKYAIDGNIIACSRCKLCVWYLYNTIYGCSRCHCAHELFLSQCGVLAVHLSLSLELSNIWTIHDCSVRTEKVSQFITLEPQWHTYLHMCITIRRWS